ncbi:ABC transporter ATP-binding protein [Aneurinibacillus sp. BA2021]|nr:ABC transporter ATP-binding protein [Aneurinibacillus sp. BA2021]
MKNKLVLKNVSKVYDSGEAQVKALDDVSLAVKEGEFIAVVGPSGSGKSTFLSIAGALLSPSEGQIFIDDEEITNLSQKELNEVRLNRIGFIFQSSNLVPYLTVQDQLLLLPKLAGTLSQQAKQKSIELLEHVELGHRLKNYPEALSGGERQRVAIARAFMNDPDLILADEPTASLDSRRGRNVVEMLAAEVKSRKKAAIMVTHDERMLDICDRVITIQDGRLV